MGGHIHMAQHGRLCRWKGLSPFFAMSHVLKMFSSCCTDAFTGECSICKACLSAAKPM